MVMYEVIIFYMLGDCPNGPFFMKWMKMYNQLDFLQLNKKIFILHFL